MYTATSERAHANGALEGQRCANAETMRCLCEDIKRASPQGVQRESTARAQS